MIPRNYFNFSIAVYDYLLTHNEKSNGREIVTLPDLYSFAVETGEDDVTLYSIAYKGRDEVTHDLIIDYEVSRYDIFLNLNIPRIFDYNIDNDNYYMVFDVGLFALIFGLDLDYTVFGHYHFPAVDIFDFILLIPISMSSEYEIDICDCSEDDKAIFVHGASRCFICSAPSPYPKYSYMHATDYRRKAHSHVLRYDDPLLIKLKIGLDYGYFNSKATVMKRYNFERMAEIFYKNVYSNVGELAKAIIERKWDRVGKLIENNNNALAATFMLYHRLIRYEYDDIADELKRELNKRIDPLDCNIRLLTSRFLCISTVISSYKKIFGRYPTTSELFAELFNKE